MHGGIPGISIVMKDEDVCAEEMFKIASSTRILFTVVCASRMICGGKVKRVDHQY
jgi:hypothetical protein